MHDGDVVSRSDGSGTTATRTPVSRTMSINFLDESVKAGSGPPAFCGNYFIRCRELDNILSRNVLWVTGKCWTGNDDVIA